MTNVADRRITLEATQRPQKSVLIPYRWRMTYQVTITTGAHISAQR
jgi:hypothetical protein